MSNRGLTPDELRAPQPHAFSPEDEVCALEADEEQSELDEENNVLKVARANGARK